MSRTNNKSLRGDTFIEVMFAIAVFALVAVLSITMMNAGIATSERSLELVVARNELNAQAEALRFIHSAYTAEMTLPTCEAGGPERCQTFKSLWTIIKNYAIDPSDYKIKSPIEECKQLYADTGDQRLISHKAFVINTRAISSLVMNRDDTGDIFVRSNNFRTVAGTPVYTFQEAPLGARIIYGSTTGSYTEGSSSAEVMSTAGNPLSYTRIARVEGIWVIAVKGYNDNMLVAGSAPSYYDFYIGTCWYGSGTAAPTSLDAVVRLTNPEAF